jgi:glycosyltransferase involved in cell wall biosynthesis
MAPTDISVIVPLLNEEESLPELAAWIARVMQANNFNYEIIMIDDGSTDSSWQVIKKLKEEYQQVKGIRFQRNYGKSAALNTGFQASVGEVVITMDADLQDSPDEIPGLYKMITEGGYDLVSGWKQVRHDPIGKTLPSKFFNAVTRTISGIPLHDFNCGLKAYKGNVARGVEVYGEMHRYIPLIAKWEGFKKIGEKAVEHRARKYGTTKFGLERFIKGFLDLLSISFVSRFRKSPMHFFGTLGTVSMVVGGGIAIYLMAAKVYYTNVLNQLAPRDVVDQPLFFLALTAFLVGVQLFLAGFLAELISLNYNDRNNYGIVDRIE